jgi:hypothetical protein
MTSPAATGAPEARTALARGLASFGVEPDERRSVLLMLAHSAAMGFGTVYFETAASALFLGSFSASALPGVYLASAGVAAATGFAFARLQTRTRFRTLMAGTLLVLAIAVVLLRGALALSSAAALLFSALVFYRLISILTDLEYWAVAARIYDLRQAKRLFGFIGTGEVVARILGAFSVPLFLRFGPVENLFAASAAALLVCFFLARLVLDEFAPAEEKPRRDARGDATPKAVWAPLFADPYIRLVIFVAFLGVLGKYLVDFAFLERVRFEIRDTRELASFLGLFSGLSQTASLAARLFVSGRVLSTLGVHRGLLVLPALHVACTALIVLAGLASSGGSLPGAEAAVFWLVVLNQGIYKTFKHPIDNPSIKVLYQPIPKDRRLSLAIAVEALLTPVGIGVSGVLMTAYATVFQSSPARFSVALLAVFIVWLVAARRTADRYKDALTHALKGRLEDVVIAFNDESAVHSLTQKIAAGSEDEALAALRLLGDNAPDSLRPLLSGLLAHASPGVREAALERIAALRPPGISGPVRALLDREKEPRVLARGLRALAAVDGADALPILRAHAESKEPAIEDAAVRGLLGADPDAGFAHLEKLARGEATARQRAARLLRGVASARGDALIEKLLDDPAARVVREACATAGLRRTPALIARLVAAVGHPPFDSSARAALLAAGVEALPALKDAFRISGETYRRRALALVISGIRVPEAAEFLLAHLDTMDALTRSEVLRRLSRARELAPTHSRETVERLIAAEARAALEKLAFVRDLEGTRFGLLPGALRGSFANSRERILLLLSLTRDPQALAAARAHLDSPTRDRRAYAREILDVVLTRDEREWLLPAIEDDLDALSRDAAEALGGVDLARRPPDERLRQIFSAPPGRFEMWVKATAFDAAASGGSDGIREAAQDFLRSDEGKPLTGALRRPRAPSQTSPGKAPMLLVERVITLRAVEMFAKVPEDLLADVAAIVEEVHLKADERVFSKGEDGESLYVIVRGRVRVHDEGEELAQLGEKTVFGELALLDPEPRSASVTTMTEAHFLKLDREAFLELMQANGEVVRGVLTVLCERVRNMTAVLHQHAKGATRA